VLWVLPVVIAGQGAAAQASTLNTAQLFVSPNFSGGSGPYQGLDNENGVASLSGSATGGFDSSGAGTSLVNWGVIKLSGDAAGSLNTIAGGIFRDELTITAPGVATGTLGSLTFSLIVDGNLDVGAVGSSAAGWQLQADLGGGAFDINAGGRQYAPGLGGAYVGTPLGSFSATVNFQFGFAAPLDVELTASAQAAYDSRPGMPTASFDLAHSLYWGGIGNISINVTAVAGAVVSSASGTDYIGSFAPVPEPAAPHSGWPG